MSFFTFLRSIDPYLFIGIKYFFVMAYFVRLIKIVIQILLQVIFFLTPGHNINKSDHKFPIPKQKISSIRTRSWMYIGAYMIIKQFLQIIIILLNFTWNCIELVNFFNYLIAFEYCSFKYWTCFNWLQWTCLADVIGYYLFVASIDLILCSWGGVGWDVFGFIFPLILPIHIWFKRLYWYSDNYSNWH